MGQRLAGARDIREVSQANLIAEAESWGMRKATATRAVDKMAQRISGMQQQGAGASAAVEDREELEF